MNNSVTDAFSKFDAGCVRNRELVVYGLTLPLKKVVVEVKVLF